MTRNCSRLAEVVFLLLCVSTSTAAAQTADTKPLVESIHSVGITVGDMDRSVAFYTEVLSFEKVADVEVHGKEFERLHGIFGLRIRLVTLRLGDEFLDLTEYLTPRGRPMPADSKGNDQWFQHVAIIVSDMDRAYERLRKYKVQHASPTPQRLPDWNKNAGGIRAFYFKDPDGHFLEILQFPKDKGDERWRRKSDKLFLGIDHTAIVVRDTDRSLGFYRDLLGLRVVGTSENFGEEQERLNNVFGARLRITTLRAAKGPAIEFLEYVTPHDGRKAPADSKANDLWHWQVKANAGSVDSVCKRLGKARAPFVSSGVATLPMQPSGFSLGVVARDPDGHALMFTDTKK
jgi:catechol 2,3-dioxygenase-like lactoylglutathione lyase family enzyme